MINKKLNNKRTFLLDYTKIADIHADRLNIAILKTYHLLRINIT